MLEHALAYARRGFRVMPLHNIENGICSCRPSLKRPKAGAECPTPGKHPRIKTGRAFEAATTDEQQIRAWWQKWPRANIGIATGHQSRVCVVDADSQAGVELLKSIADRHGGLPATLMSRTGRDGVGIHWWFSCEEVSPTNSGGGLDIRGDGGNLVAPPSMHVSGRPYAWLNDAPLAPMPPWLLHWFANRDREARPDRRQPLGGGIELPAHLRGRMPLVGERAAIHELPALADVEAALEAIPNERLSWDEWNRIGMAVWRATDGSDAGLDAFDYFSQKSDKYDPEGPEERWRAYVGTPPTEIGFGSLWYMAREAQPGWTPPTQVKRETIPKEMQAFSTGSPAATLPEQVTAQPYTNGHTLGQPGMNPAPLVFKPRDPDNPLIELNEKYAVIGDVGGKCLVLGWTPSKFDKSLKVPSFQTFKSFSERYGSRYITVTTEKANGPIEEAKQLGTYWLKWTGRKSYEAIDLVPNAEPILEGNVLNLWSGFSVPAVAGSWRRMAEHIVEVLADGDHDSAAYIMRFAAWAIQNPGERAEAALVFRGEKGSGKGTFAGALRSIFGQHGLQIFSPKHLVGTFNAHLRNCLLLFADEAFWAGDKQGESTLKGLITEPSLMIEQKGVDATPWTNRLKVIMAANADWVVPAGAAERRYAVFNVSSKRVDDYAYFERVRAEMGAGGLSAMLHSLSALDLKGWHPRQIVKTAALREQKAQSMSPLQEWFENVLQEGRVPGAGQAVDRSPASALLRQAQEEVPKMRDVSAAALGRFLRSKGCVKQHDVHGSVWQFPRLAEARSQWAREFGGWTWIEDIADWRGRRA